MSLYITLFTLCLVDFVPFNLFIPSTKQLFEVLKESHNQFLKLIVIIGIKMQNLILKSFNHISFAFYLQRLPYRKQTYQTNNDPQTVICIKEFRKCSNKSELDKGLRCGRNISPKNNRLRIKVLKSTSALLN